MINYDSSNQEGVVMRTILGIVITTMFAFVAPAAHADTVADTTVSFTVPGGGLSIEVADDATYHVRDTRRSGLDWKEVVVTKGSYRVISVY